MLRLHSFSVDQTSTYKLWISAMQSKHTHMYFPWSQENAPRAQKKCPGVRSSHTSQTCVRIERQHKMRFGKRWEANLPSIGNAWRTILSLGTDFGWFRSLPAEKHIISAHFYCVIQVPHSLKDLVKSVFTIKNQHGWERGGRNFSIPNLIYWKSNNP